MSKAAPKNPFATSTPAPAPAAAKKAASPYPPMSKAAPKNPFATSTPAPAPVVKSSSAATFGSFSASPKAKPAVIGPKPASQFESEVWSLLDSFSRTLENIRRPLPPPPNLTKGSIDDLTIDLNRIRSSLTMLSEGIANSLNGAVIASSKKADLKRQVMASEGLLHSTGSSSGGVLATQPLGSEDAENDRRLTDLFEKVQKDLNYVSGRVEMEAILFERGANYDVRVNKVRMNARAFSRGVAYSLTILSSLARCRRLRVADA